MTHPALLMFSPVHKRALGVALGLWSAISVFVLTAVVVLRPGVPAPDLILLREYFAGYSVTWRGAVIGAWWAGVAGFVAGWFLALARNLFVGLAVFWFRSRAELAQARDFLDHI